MSVYRLKIRKTDLNLADWCSMNYMCTIFYVGINITHWPAL